MRYPDVTMRCIFLDRLVVYGPNVIGSGNVIGDRTSPSSTFNFQLSTFNLQPSTTYSPWLDDTIH
jgi:hypothetical protein